MAKQLHIMDIHELHELEEILPKEATINLTREDFHNGNFETAHVELPIGTSFWQEGPRSEGFTDSVRRMWYGSFDVVYHKKD